MVAATRSGGWVMIEDFDTALAPHAALEELTAEQILANRVRSGFVQLLASRGVDLTYGRKLPRLLRAAGLVEVTAVATFPVADPATRNLERANTVQVADGLVAAGHCTTAEIEQYLEVLDQLDIAVQPLVTCVGRKP